ncbi:alpha/beta hydrolase [Thioclava sp. JM3]|uniref:alpha/beta fold hydrolase n=1 Tax=Thioclava sp. JM3 TaxID=1973004 RepID=UPI000B548DF0|nr:alpha/beta fold hydrolase [Thioclava sp. JM3]OWY16803.1 alpha/beta hydrolase [Thioclava sp. JM3]
MPELSFTRAGNGPPLVLVHGYLGGSAMWDAQLAHFSPFRDVICPDLAGFGASAALEAPESIEGHARMVLGLLDRLEVERFDLLGHSMGGMVVQEMIRLAPTRIRKLILYGTGPRGVMPGRFETIAQSRERLLRDGVPATARRIAATWFRQGEAAEGFPLCLSLGQKARLQAALASLTAWEAWDGTPALGAIASPTLVLWGSRDRSYDWTQPEALWRGIPGADLAVMPGCAHNVHMEKPDRFNRLVGDFLDAADF